MSEIKIHQQGACECGQSTFTVEGTPLIRLLCHCHICQKIYQKPYADILVITEKSIKLANSGSIEFKKYRLPPAVDRGICKSCNKPVIGFMWVAPFTKIAFIPTMNLANKVELPEPSVHIFYHRRVHDIDDDLPKISGYWQSQSFTSYKMLEKYIKSGISQ